MSEFHVQQLRAVETQMEAARSALNFAVRSGERADNALELAGRKPEDFRQASAEVENVYFIYLFATFEGVLRTHLTQKHPAVRVTRQTKFDRVLFLVCQAENISLDTTLRKRIETVRDYRNHLAHGQQGTPVFISFRAALSALNTFAAKLPAP